MRSYGQEYCPVARASELFAERWTPIIVRNLLLGCSTFGEILDGSPGLSRSVLAARLGKLERHGIVTREPQTGRRGSTYVLTPAGQQLQAVCDALGTWGARWMDQAPRELDPGIVLWAVAKCMHRDQLPEERVVVRVDVRGHPRFWLLVQRPEPELCRANPGFDEDLVITTDADTLVRWHTGRVSLHDAVRDGTLTIAGPPRVARAFARWGGRSPFAGISPARPAV